MNITTRHPLTHQQAQVLAYLVKFLELNDQLPTNAKIAEAFGWASSNAADTHLKALEKKGYLARNELGHLMLADRPTEATPAQAAHHLIGQVLVLASILESSLCVVRTIEAEDSDEAERLSKLITRGEAAIATVLKEHAMASTWCAGLTRSTSLERSGVPA
ncbi:MAG: hypothetical protein K0M67_16355 [Thiobacillus sp.]|nr:hypothetical protein [Thiobacillus sp.]